MKVIDSFRSQCQALLEDTRFFPPVRHSEGDIPYKEYDLKGQVVHGCHLHFLRITGPRVTRVVRTRHLLVASGHTRDTMDKLPKK